MLQYFTVKLTNGQEHCCHLDHIKRHSVQEVEVLPETSDVDHLLEVPAASEFELPAPTSISDAVSTRIPEREPDTL